MRNDATAKSAFWLAQHPSQHIPLCDAALMQVVTVCSAHTVQKDRTWLHEKLHRQLVSKDVCGGRVSILQLA
jgi:hypothetical protein